MTIRNHSKYKEAVGYIKEKILPQIILNDNKLIAQRRVYMQDAGYFSIYDLANKSVESLDLIRKLIQEFFTDSLARIIIETPEDNRRDNILDFLKQVPYLFIDDNKQPCFCISQALKKKLDLADRNEKVSESKTLGKLGEELSRSRNAIIKLLDSEIIPKIDAFAKEKDLSDAQRKHLQTKYYFKIGTNTYFTPRLLEGDAQGMEGNPQVPSLTNLLEDLFSEHESLITDGWLSSVKIAENNNVDKSTISQSIRAAISNLNESGVLEEDMKRTVACTGKSDQVTLYSPTVQQEVETVRAAIDQRKAGRTNASAQRQ